MYNQGLISPPSNARTTRGYRVLSRTFEFRGKLYKGES